MSLSQNNEVLIYLQQHGSITPMEAEKEFACRRLGARIYDLRRNGHDIRTIPETRKNRFGKPVTYARYSMEPHKLPADPHPLLKAECGRT